MLLIFFCSHQPFLTQKNHQILPSTPFLLGPREVGSWGDQISFNSAITSCQRLKHWPQARRNSWAVRTTASFCASKWHSKGHEVAMVHIYIYTHIYIYVCIIYSIHENQSDKWWSIRTVTIDAIDDAWGHHHFISLVKTLAKSNDIYIRNTPLCLGL